MGNRFVITIPKEGIERLGLEDGQLLENQVTPLDVRPVLSRPVLAAFERNWARSERAYRYLTDRSADRYVARNLGSRTGRPVLVH